MTTSIYTRAQNFINKSNKVHNEKYDYSKCNYINSKTKVEIICPTHGSFWQRMDAHYSGQGCPKCYSGYYCGSNFTKRSSLIHKNKYDYSKTLYIDNNTKLTITCPVHGDFEQIPRGHLSGKGCMKCAISYRSLRTKKDSPRANEYCVLYDIKIYNDNETFYKTGISKDYIKRHNDIHIETKYNIDILNIIIDTRYNCEQIEYKILKKRQRKSNYTPLIKFNGWTECYL